MGAPTKETRGQMGVVAVDKTTGERRTFDPAHVLLSTPTYRWAEDRYEQQDIPLTEALGEGDRMCLEAWLVVERATADGRLTADQREALDGQSFPGDFISVLVGMIHGRV